MVKVASAILVVTSVAAVACGDDDGAVEAGVGCAGDVALVASTTGAYEEGSDIIALTTDGEVRRLTEDNGSYGPSISPDGTQIVFAGVGTEGEVADTTGPGGLELYVMGSDGTRRRRLLEGSEDQAPDWSSDGEQIAFVRAGPPEDEEPDRIHVVAADGRDERLLVAHDGLEDDGHPAWSPDGSQLALVRRGPRGERTQVIVVAADGSGPDVVYDGPDWVGAPTWSPDGTRLAFPVGPSDEASALRIVDVDDGEVVVGPGPLDGVTWAPSGRLYGFGRAGAVADVSGQWRVAEVEPDDAGGFASPGRVVSEIDPVGYLYTDYGVDVPSCLGPDASPLTSEADEPAVLVVAHPTTGDDVAVIPRREVMARRLNSTILEPEDVTIEAQLVFTDPATTASIRSNDGIDLGLPADTLLWLVAYQDQVAVYAAETGASLLSFNGGLPDVPDLAP